MNLIPEIPGNAPNYWCTWALQNYIFGQNDPNFAISELEGADGSFHARNNMNEQSLHKWIEEVFPEVRSDLFLVLDDGWDLPLLQKKTGNLTMFLMKKNLSSFNLFQDRFPSYNVNHPSQKEKLKMLNQRIQRAGWRGMGIWVAAQEASAFSSWKDWKKKKYWQERFEWCKEAGIHYWKVDWGFKCLTPSFRKMLTDISKKIAPQILVEHARNFGPFNDKLKTGQIEESFTKSGIKLLSFSDTYRLYDISPQLAVPSMLERIAQILVNAPKSNSGMQILHCEDEPYMGAALGCAFGVMRYPYINLRMKNGKDIDFSFCQSRNIKKRLTEVIRAVRWHRIASPFAANQFTTQLSTNSLFDEWFFKPDEFWDKSVHNKSIKQGAPAIISRGLPLPVVLPTLEANTSNDEVPYIGCCRYPNGAIAIATFGRTFTSKGYYTPLAKVSIEAVESNGVFGIFGLFDQLTIHLKQSKPIREVWTQDLAGKEAQNITQKIQIDKERIVLPGKLLKDWGSTANNSNDESEPGCLIQFVF